MARLHRTSLLFLNLLFWLLQSTSVSVYGNRVIIFSSPNANPLKATNDCNPKCSEIGGVCITNECRCFDGYIGQLCEKAICRGGCYNGGFCDQPNRCACPVGFKGRQCEKPHCPSRCMNGGRCVAVLGRRMCNCPYGFKGRMCQHAVCKTPCLHDGHCVKPDTCACAPGWTGSHCQFAVCVEKCRNDGECAQPNTCTCKTGYSGQQCEIEIGQEDEEVKRKKLYNSYAKWLALYT